MFASWNCCWIWRELKKAFSFKFLWGLGWWQFGLDFLRLAFPSPRFLSMIDQRHNIRNLLIDGILHQPQTKICMYNGTSRVGNRLFGSKQGGGLVFFFFFAFPMILGVALELWRLLELPTTRLDVYFKFSTPFTGCKPAIGYTYLLSSWFGTSSTRRIWNDTVVVNRFLITLSPFCRCFSFFINWGVVVAVVQLHQLGCRLHPSRWGAVLRYIHRFSLIALRGPR